MIVHLNQNAGAVTALATVALLLVTGWHAWTTRAMLREVERSRLLAAEPRVVAYLRAHEVHSNIVQLCIANLSGAAAVGVSASVDEVTEWPECYDLGDSAILRDLSFLRPHEVLRFDLGAGPELFRDEEPAVLRATIGFESLDVVRSRSRARSRASPAPRAGASTGPKTSHGAWRRSGRYRRP